MKRVMGTRTPISKTLTMSALGLVLASQVAFAQDAGQQSGSAAAASGEAWQASFNEVDTNDNNAAEWQEIETTYDDQLQEAGWGEEEVFDRFDRNDDGVIDDPEYVFFMTGLENAQRTASAGGQQNQQSQQDRVTQQNTQMQGQQQYEQQDQLAQADQGQDDQANEQQDMVVLEEEGREELQPNVAGLRDQSDQAAQQTQQDGVAQQNMQGRQSQPGGQNQQASNQQGQQSPQGDVVTLVAVTAVQEVPIADIEERPVVNLQGEQVGEVEDVVVNQDSNETGLVVSVGGFWDIGDKDIYVSLDDVVMRADQVIWETMAGEEELEELPEYNEQDYVSVR